MSTISVIIPCYNEAAYIGKFIDSLEDLSTAPHMVSYIIADGGSDDGTRAIIAEKQSGIIDLTVIDNPKRIVSSGLNLAITMKDSEFIVRLDVHSTYDQKYILNCIDAIISSGAACVGGPWNIRPGDTLMSSAISAAFKSPLGSGGALSRNINYDGFVDTVYLGAWRRDTLIDIGLFDESFVRNQDDELCLRIIERGEKIYQDSRIKSEYQGRRSAQTLFQQFYQYGFWKVFVVFKHRKFANLRHIVPFAFLAMIICLFAVSIPMLLVFLLLYSGSLLFGQLLYTRYQGVLHIILSVYCISLMHISYGAGFFKGMLFKILSLSTNKASLVNISR